MSKFHPLAHLYSEGVSPIIFKGSGKSLTALVME